MATLRYMHGGPLTLIPASCIHYPVGDADLLKEWVKRIKQDPTARTILMGDLIDQDRTTHRKHRKSYVADRNSRLHDDRHMDRELKGIIEILRPIRGKILGMLEGNHFYEYATGISSDQKVCEALEVPFLGALGAIKLVMLRKGSNSRKSLTVFAHHSGGTAGGRTTGGSVNALLRQENAWDADVYLLGHDHRRIAWREATLALNDAPVPAVVERTKVFARVGAFLKGHDHEGCVSTKSPYFPSYAEAAAYRPTDLGWIEIKMDLRHSRVAGERIVYDITTPSCN